MRVAFDKVLLLGLVRVAFSPLFRGASGVSVVDLELCTFTGEVVKNVGRLATRAAQGTEDAVDHLFF